MSPSPGDALVSCVKKVPTDVMGKDYTQQFELWRWCLHLPDRPEPTTLHLKKRIHFKVEINLLASSRAQSRIITTGSALRLFTYLSSTTDS